MGRGGEGGGGEEDCVHSAGFEPTTYRMSLQIVNIKNRAEDHLTIAAYV